MELDYEKIRSKQELLEFIRKLSSEDTGEWENVSAPDFLRALGAWLDSASGFYNNFKLETSAEEPSWQLFADALQAATIYE